MMERPNSRQHRELGPLEDFPLPAAGHVLSAWVRLAGQAGVGRPSPAATARKTGEEQRGLREDGRPGPGEDKLRSWKQSLCTWEERERTRAGSWEE